MPRRAARWVGLDPIKFKEVDAGCGEDGQGMLNGSGLRVSFQTCPSGQRLEPEWQTLESRSAATFFNSWSWIGTWLSGLGPGWSPQLLRASLQGETVGLGVLVPGTIRRLRVLPSRSLHLHATGDPRADDLCVEHNGLLVQTEGQPFIAAAMMGHLLGPDHRWEQLHLHGLSSTPPAVDRLAPPWRLRQEAEPAYLVNLEAIRSQEGDYLSQLSANSRSMIRRSLKAYATLGPVHTASAQDVPEAVHFLGQLKALHQRTWQSRGASGAFANPRFEAHHRELIHRHFERGEVQLLRVHAGERDIGYLYNFVYRGRVTAYQSGFDYDLVARTHSPGLTAHALAVQRSADAGLQIYDFLAGDARYKRDLATDAYQMVNVSVHRPTLSLLMEEQWRRLKQRPVVQTLLRAFPRGFLRDVS